MDGDVSGRIKRTIANWQGCESITTNGGCCFTTQNNSFEPTEINCLENRFYHLVREVRRWYDKSN